MSRRLLVSVAAAGVMLLGGATVSFERRGLVYSWLGRVFGPVDVTLREAHERRPGGPTVDHALFDAVLREHVDGRGDVDYAGLAREPARLDAYLESLAAVEPEALGRDERLALLLNAYNAATLRLVLDHWPLESIKDIPAAERWEAVRWTIGDEVLSLDRIEHEEIRPAFAEPRIHFALVCAAKSCPVLRREAYVGERLEAQLEDQARFVHADARWFELTGDGTLRLTMLYHPAWYGDDFAQISGTALGYAARYSPELARRLASGDEPPVRWIDYDWSINAAGPPGS